MTTARRTRSASETERLGEALAPALDPGDVVLLRGPLGSGKTCFVTGLARGLQCAGRVRSPTFGLVHEYRGRILLVHLDLYRLDAVEAGALGLEEYAERAALVAEWGEKLPAAWRADALGLEFSFGGEADQRAIVAEAEGARGRALLEAWERIPPSRSRSESAA